MPDVIRMNWDANAVINSLIYAFTGLALYMTCSEVTLDLKRSIHMFGPLMVSSDLTLHVTRLNSDRLKETLSNDIDEW